LNGQVAKKEAEAQQTEEEMRRYAGQLRAQVSGHLYWNWSPSFRIRIFLYGRVTLGLSR
jgi:hypothetical protein